MFGFKFVLNKRGITVQELSNFLIKILSFGVEIVIYSRGGKISEFVTKSQSKIQNLKSPKNSRRLGGRVRRLRNQYRRSYP